MDRVQIYVVPLCYNKEVPQSISTDQPVFTQTNMYEISSEQEHKPKVSSRTSAYSTVTEQVCEAVAP